MYHISRSHWRKAAALVIAVAAFVWLYETRILDSQHVHWTTGDETHAAPGSRLPFSATAYCKGSTTASGVRVRTGVAAADPALLPVGSVVNVATGDPQYNGVYTVMDTGPAVKGRQLDLYIWSCHEALRFGRKRVQVTVLRLGWDPKASSPTLIDRLFRGREASRRALRPEPPPPAGVPPDAGSTTPDEGVASEPAPEGQDPGKSEAAADGETITSAGL